MGAGEAVVGIEDALPCAGWRNPAWGVKTGKGIAEPRTGERITKAGFPIWLHVYGELGWPSAIFLRAAVRQGSSTSETPAFLRRCTVRKFSAPGVRVLSVKETP